FDWPVLAHERVRFIGERVVAVAADTRDAAEEAVGLVEVEYEELEPVLDPESAIRGGAPVPWPPTIAANLQGHTLTIKGDPDIEHALAQADRIIEDTYTAPRQHQGYIEPHAAVVWVK